MNYEKQVEKSHYEFSHYMSKERWSSVWHQVDEILKCCPETVLEIGKGTGMLGAILNHYGIVYKSADIDPDLEPDYIASATNLPFEDNAFDVVGCFQVLEHIPYASFSRAVSEIARVAKNKFIISLPDAKAIWQYRFHVPKLGIVRLDIPRPQLRPKEHLFSGEHYWEINKASYPLSRIVSDIEGGGGIIEKSFRVIDNPGHRFFVAMKRI